MTTVLIVMFGIIGIVVLLALGTILVGIARILIVLERIEREIR